MVLLHEHRSPVEHKRMLGSKGCHVGLAFCRVVPSLCGTGQVSHLRLTSRCPETTQTSCDEARIHQVTRLRLGSQFSRSSPCRANLYQFHPQEDRMLPNLLTSGCPPWRNSTCRSATGRKTCEMLKAERRVSQCLDLTSAIVKPVHECHLQRKSRGESASGGMLRPSWHAPRLVFDTLENPPWIKSWCLSAALEGERSGAF